MNNVLLVGNGFDLAHGLLTKYEHFLYLMKHWDVFYSSFTCEMEKMADIEKKGKDVLVDKSNSSLSEIPFSKFLKHVSDMNKANIDKLSYIIKNNSWAIYYQNCEAEIDGWIDFEREIYPVVELFEFIIKSNYHTSGHRGEYVDAYIDKEYLTPQMLRTASLWRKYIGVGVGDTISVRPPYVSLKYGILKKRILESLRKEFDEFIYAFEIYLYEFVYKNDNIKPLKQIKDLGINSVISFNYTLTEKLYGVVEDDVHHLHGMIREDLTQGKNNMIMGVNESSEQNMEFIYFVKYFQRIQKSSGTRYKELLRKGYKNSYGFTENAYSLYIYGHSLDETDKDIITYIIGTKEELAEDTMRTQHVTIFYYDAADYEQKVINLINLYGRDIVEAFMERKWFEFVPTSSAVIEV